MPGLLIDVADPSADALALARLATWALRRFAPIVAVDPPDGLVIDSTGADHLHRGEPAMLRTMLDRLTVFGVAAHAAVADTWGAAHALARCGARPLIVSHRGRTRQDIASLPLMALRVPTAMVADLQRLGFERIGDLLDKPRAPLALRFGPELVRRIDQALGIVSEPIDPYRPAELVEARQTLAEPIATADAIGRVIGRLVTALCAELETKGLGARRLDLLCHRVDSHAQAVRVGMARPVRDVKRVTRLLCDKIETIDPGFGIETMALVASIAEPLPQRQSAASLIEAPVTDVSDLLDTLVNRVGRVRLYRASPVASDVPERTVGRIPALSADEGMLWSSRWPRPPRLLARPEPIDAMALLPDHPPVAFTWRGIRRRVARADGPERIFGEWWKRDAELTAVRDYFQVEDEAGERYWIYRAGDGEDAATGSHRWFLHGVFG